MTNPEAPGHASLSALDWSCFFSFFLLVLLFFPLATRTFKPSTKGMRSFSLTVLSPTTWASPYLFYSLILNTMLGKPMMRMIPTYKPLEGHVQIKQSIIGWLSLTAQETEKLMSFILWGHSLKLNFRFTNKTY